MLLQLWLLQQHGWEGVKGSCGWLLGSSDKRAPLCAAYTGMVNGE